MSTHLLLWLIGTLAPLTTPGMAHEKGIIRFDSKEVPAGGELGIQGEKLPKNAILRLELRGTLDAFSLAEVRTNSAGKFRARLALPREADDGRYTVVALAADGDVVARAELVITAVTRNQAMDRASRESIPAGGESPHPTAEMMRLAVATTGGEWVAILTIIAASLGGGLLLLRGSRSRPT